MKFPCRLEREHVQILSLAFMASGVFAVLDTDFFNLGTALIAAAVWVMLMSESILLSKVQNEMRTALEKLSLKKEKEVEEVLYFLRDSSIAASPFKSIDGAKRLCQRMPFPTMVLTTNYQIIKANTGMHELLGWREHDLNGVSAHTVNDTIVMSKVGAWAALPENADKQCIATQYAYLKKSGEKILGQMCAVKIGLEGFFVMFMPTDHNVISLDEIKETLDF
tara:strand:- start:7636 stop:8301 length:666 start_codon:yes stop_codon:yes gene_type:complete